MFNLLFKDKKIDMSITETDKAEFADRNAYILS